MFEYRIVVFTPVILELISDDKATDKLVSPLILESISDNKPLDKLVLPLTLELIYEDNCEYIVLDKSSTIDY